MKPTQIPEPGPRNPGTGARVRDEISGSCPPADEPVELGRGRSGFVYLGLGPDGRSLASKVFASCFPTKLVQCLFLGTPNPYMWNEDAVQCAVLRRRVLAELVGFWFRGRLWVAGARGHNWSEEHLAFEIHTEFSPGLPIPLHSPFRTRSEGLLQELTSEVMKPLQRHLIDSGFDGLAWQAGKGNPVALNNFLFEDEGERRWAWIDLESGVPALFPANPIAFFSFYAPSALRYGRPMFDDVDTEKLLRYLSSNHAALGECLGEPRLLQLREEVLALRDHQAAWKGQSWLRRSIAYRLSQREITAAEAEEYRGAPFRWAGLELARYAGSFARGIGRAALRVARFLESVPWRGVPRFLGRLAGSQRFRGFVARMFVAGRINAWRTRGQLTDGQARHLRMRLRREESSAYISDFGVHIAIKPFVKAIEFWVLPAMWVAGWIGGGTLAVSMLACGPVIRTAYTAFRVAQASRRRAERPWAALGIGMVPVAGNFAYPLQIIYSSTEKDLARFILYDGCARVGALLPIWGGKDTWTEHWFNRLPDLFANVRGREGAPPLDPV